MNKLHNILYNLRWIISIILAVVILILIVFFIIKKPIKWNGPEEERLTTVKEEAITFLKENINELKPIYQDLLNNDNDKCKRWKDYQICYHNETVTISELGLNVAVWDLKYSNNRWYSIDKRTSTPIDITDYIK